ncbi:putative ribonuclease H-like domain-containing protein [Tanacetum coccineum]|uniref:Ribonuclease H-like domain-containing protein n=1 Tax=Tanacetum coccineum TaxID=301880 RepID=A0ABQ4ZH87_9ASTR
MDLFGPISVRSINHKTYFLVVTDDFSRFSWVFFLATKDETSGILKTFITGIENQINHKVKIIRCDNGTEFKNKDMNQFCVMKGIKKEFSVARTPQRNEVAERKNRTLIEAARTMLADSLLPTIFWAEAVNTACYVRNRVLVTKPHNKTPYELLHGRPPSISFMRPFGCPVTILNTLDPLGKFDGKDDEGFLVRYSIHSKAFRVFNTRTRKVEENLHITFLENKPNVAGSGPDWLFDIDLLTNSMIYEQVTTGNQTNKNVGIKDNVDAIPTQQFILLPLLYDSPHSLEDMVANDASKKTTEEPANDLRDELDNLFVQQKQGYANSTSRVSTISPSVSAVRKSFINANDLPTDPFMSDLEDATDLLLWQACHLGAKMGYARNKKDERGIVVRNKARLVAQDDAQEIPNEFYGGAHFLLRVIGKAEKDDWESHQAKTSMLACAIEEGSVLCSKLSKVSISCSEDDALRYLKDKAVFKERDDRVVRATTTVASLDATHASGNITNTQSTAMSNDPLSQKIGSGVNIPGSDEEMFEHQKLTNNVPPTPHDSPLLGGHTPGSDEGRLKQDKLTDIITTLLLETHKVSVTSKL